jgi:multidrug resistance efflux pump
MPNKVRAQIPARRVGFAPRQDLDKAAAAVRTARAKLAAAEKTYEAARLGPTREELAIADAKEGRRSSSDKAWKQKRRPEPGSDR